MEQQVDSNINETNAEHADDARARFVTTLKANAARINSVRNDVYTTKWWQFVINFFLGCGALAFLITSMTTSGVITTVSAIVGVVLVVALVLFNYLLRAATPTSFLQYTYLERAKDKRYCFQVLSKTRATYFDGVNTVESNRDMAALQPHPYFSQYRFDFFADMEPTERIADGEKETFIGIFRHDGKTYKSKIVFKNSVPLYGTVGGARIKYFDVNNTKDKFVVPGTLKRAAKALNIDFPKIPGLYVKDDVKDFTKQ